MGKLIGSMDWSRTPLGPIDGWPQSLRTVVSLCVAANAPISLTWGPHRVQIYNDGYRSLCGGKHPRAMGQDFSECWASAWPAIGGAFERAQAGKTSCVENQRLFLDRNGSLEETFLTFSFSPIRDESGSVRGIFHPVTEQTGRMLSERRTRALRDLAERTGRATAVGDVLAAAAHTLAQYDLDLPFVLFYLLADDGTAAVLVAQAGIEPDTIASPAVLDLTAAAAAWPLAEAVRSGHAVQVDGLEQRFGPLSCGPYAEAPRTAFILPILAAGSDRPTAILVAGTSSRLALDEAYRAFFELVAASITAALANVRAGEDERRRAEAVAERDRAKTAFFGNISHEFRTLLSLMLGPVEDALDASADLPAMQRARLEVAHRNALRLLKLVNTLLDFFRIEAGRMQASFAPTDLAAFTAELADNFRSACDQAGLRLLVDCPPLPALVFVDTDMWEKIVLNLLSNAFKFTFKGGIDVSLRAVGRDHVELAVRDSGTGIAEHELPRLFDRFHRVEASRGRSGEGSGIGLALVLELVKLHNGTLTVESKVDRGSIFRVTVPLGTGHLPPDQLCAVRTPGAAAARPNVFVEEALRWLPDAPAVSPASAATIDHAAVDGASASAGANRPRIVLAEDNADMRTYLSQILEEAGYEVHAVADGEAALAAARPRAVAELVLSDVVMPRLDGFGLLKALRADPALHGLRVILLSGRAGGEKGRAAGMAAGADDYLVKPFSARELLARTASAVRLARARREALALERDLPATLVAERGRTQLSEAQAQLRVAEEKYRLLMAQAQDAILVLDAAGVVRDANRNAEVILGRPRADIVGRPLQDYIAAAQAADLQNLLDGSALGLAELRLIHRDGKEHNVEVSAARLHIHDEEVVLLIARDITKRLLLEQQLRQAQKMEAVGQLTGGVAHDFNNILTVITGTIEILAEAVSGDPKLAAIARLIDESAERGAQLTQRMLAFARKQPLRTRTLDLNEIVTRALVMLQRTLGEDIAVTPVLAPDLWSAVADPSQIEDAILNLALNARDAMPKGGRLAVETANVHLDEHYAAHNVDVIPGDYVALIITDSGTGMPPEVIERAFEPFFTTKDSGRGTGLGLSMVYGFARQSGGHVKIYSEAGHGTSIKVYLPRAKGALTEVAAPVAAPRATGGKRETILVVEDDPAVRRVAVTILESLGYLVRQAENGQAALDILQTPDAIDLLFTDMIMPNGMSGHDLLGQARERRPALRALFTSGYSQHFIREHSTVDRTVPLLDKPYGKLKLAQKIREALDQAAGAG